MSGEITKKDLPTTFWCEDFEVGRCCDQFTSQGWCHADSDFLVLRQRLITVYPESIFSIRHKHKMPDFSLGLTAEVCCGRYEAVKQLPRSWWITKYGEKHGYRPEHIEQLQNALPENYYRLTGEIGSLYYREKHGTVSGSRTVSDSNRRAAFSQRGTARVSAYTCSSCKAEIKRNADVCDNCGAPQ